MKIQKLLAVLLTVTMLMSISPAFGAFAAEDSAAEAIAFDAKNLTISGEQDVDAGGWTVKSNIGVIAAFNQNWVKGVWGNDATGGNYALSFFMQNEGGAKSGDGTVEVALNNAADTLRTEKLSIDFDLAMMDNDHYGFAQKAQGWGGANGALDVYQTWTYLDLDGNEIAKFSFDINVGGHCGQSDISFANSSDIMQKQGVHVTITITKADAGYKVCYFVNDEPITEEICEKVNGFGSVRAFLGTYNDQYGGAGMENLKITYIPKTGKADVKLVLKLEDKEISKDIPNLFIGDEYTPSEEDAPLIVIEDGEVYMRNDMSPALITAGDNTVSVTYTKAEFESVDVPEGDYFAIAGNHPNFPSVLNAKTKDGKTIALDAVWSTDADVSELQEEETVTYSAKLAGYKGSVTAEAVIYPCDHAIGTEENPVFYHAGNNSDGANLELNNKLGYIYGGGTMINEFDFVLNNGSNMLIMYGSTDSLKFDGMGALIRFMKSGNSVEYFNGNWLSSSLTVKHNTPYRLRTIIDITNKRYSMYLSENGGAYETVCENAKFRNSGLAKIDRMATSGDIKSVVHRTYWKDGFSKINVSFVDNTGASLAKGYIAKCSQGGVYTAPNAPQAIEKDNKTYIRDSINSAPSVKVDGDMDYAIEYHEVTITDVKASSVILVRGDTALNMPVKVNVTFSDSQSTSYPVTWDTSAVDNNVVGAYTVHGKIAELPALDVLCTVEVKDVTILPHTSQNTVATNNGGWNWYVEPSGTHIQPGDELATRYQSGAYSTGGYEFKHDRTYMGWVEDGGDIVIAQYDHDLDTYQRVIIHEKLESDDHNNPAVVILPDGRIMAVYSMHTNEPYMYYRVTKNPEDITEWNKEQFYLCHTDTDMEKAYYNATYPTVFMVHDDEGIKGNDTIYMGWRGVHWKPTMAKFSMPNENGVCEVKMGQTQFANTSYYSKDDGGAGDGGRRPYTKYDYDFERNKIYITFTSNHPDNDNNNHVYYVCLDIADQNLYTSKGTYLQPLPRENQPEYKAQGAAGTNGQWGVITDNLVGIYPELFIFNANEQTASGGGERRGWTWDISHNEKGEPCVVYVDVTATPPGEGGALPSEYHWEWNGDTRTYHYYWYARWDSDTQEWVKTFLTYGGKWWHENATQERCYSGGLTFDHNAEDANVLFLAIPTMGTYGNMFEIYRWESEDHGATWTIREPLTQNSKVNNARPNAIYNYKEDEDGNHQGPRLLWISGEYRYWMNYEYKTGVLTDFSAPGFITQDDPEMFADAALYQDGEELASVPVGSAKVTGRFNISNISIGDGTVKIALAHYNKDGALVNVVTDDVEIPARSVPQTGILGAPLTENGSLSKMGDDEIKPEIEYEAVFEEGDRITLMAWNMGIEHPMSSIMQVPFSMTTEGDMYAYKETFTYEGDSVLHLNDDPNNYNGWIGHRYYSGSQADCVDDCYAGIIKAPFGNTSLHLYHKGEGGVMASHSIPAITDKDYEINFTIRYINEWSWNNTANAGFSLAHGMPKYANDIDTASCAFQFRHGSAWGQENGRGNTGYLRRTRWFDGSELSWFFMNDIPRYMDTENMIEDYYVDNGNGNNRGYYDLDTETYVHDVDDSLMVGSLYRFKVVVSPVNKTVTMSINDGYRTITRTESYVDNDSYDWDNNPIDTIIFNIGNDKWGEMYIDDLTVKVID